MPTVDGHQWKRQRIAFLEERLEHDPPDEERTAIEQELRQLKPSRWGWLWPRLPHQR